MLYKIVSIFTCMKVGLGLVPYKRDVVAKNNLGKRSRNKCVVVVVVASVVEPKPESL